MTRPQQAVILCGGLGTRLRPLTDTLPKPLAPVNGRPFLTYLLEQLRDQGIERVVLLTGYRGEMIRHCFADGAVPPMRIDFSHGPVEWETGRRLWEAREGLDERFLLLYSDNFAPFNLNKLAAAHESSGASVTLTLQRKEKGNVRLAAAGAIEVYDSSRTADALDYVEIGYMIVERDQAFAELPAPDVSFSRVLHRLAAQGRLAGMVTADPYHSISDVARWKLAERYLESKRILMLDRDGTINVRPARGQYVTSWEHFQWIDDTVDAMRQLAAYGFRFIVVSNQAGIGRGMQQADAVADINRRMVSHLAGQGIDVIDVYVCPHHWEDGCDCRKPAPGMFFKASREHLVRLDRTVYVGDDVRDCLAAFNAECLSVLIGPERHQNPGNDVRPAFAAETLPEAVSWIVKRFESWETATRIS